ncbi:hypothetical protein D8B26_006080 [Coccidioides posadasii str. Silveira]|uniref:Uncharacterized protein n=2 Tax=Coccidioides posadasii TaxID=199306 RepID=E9DBR6_COCPS|nr:hypothetical protein CPC735_031480 [Coccidioides posadasii C735 delta SOWgp]EER27812.1 hypothetical protein CPC735_031480 [Coccidioides posadasii C735 delta SOWgp]EFW16218.1 conserved hypothetical protein [Coccidioides posadasii str. Silveira]QVM11432.1 hypothetical protein D8B26_006080 [Coccidioides posadasii str. Silveira]|eukprot:XP_003069957.1 hypothetical protein CPC735_031480 [Coccidioides posadasii C735 delta SOWgp]
MNLTPLLWIACLRVGLVFGAANFAVPWSSTKYGPDGPWQAVKVSVGGVDETLRYNLQSTDLDLYPGSRYASQILVPEACEPHERDGICGKGGKWDITAKSTMAISWPGSYENPPMNQTSGECDFNIQGLTINDITVWNTSLVAVDNVTITTAKGITYGPPVGLLALGGDKTVQEFTTSSSRTGALRTYIYPGGLYDQDIIPSYSYTLQIGSAAHDYVGSLVFGGYDKGRIIGPYTTSAETTFRLLDIGIGVQTGGSPFPFKKKDNLLVTGTSSDDHVTVYPDATLPYMFLPAQTCEEIVKHLPVEWDSELSYYLWKTDDPLYKSITSSPAYLSFTFPPASGAEDNVVIKVPFALLNLTLESPITESPKIYFPCYPFSLTENDDNYHLGRAFLQAAFLGRNWLSKMTWLAQAPGPGSQLEGLGKQLEDIPDRANTLSYFDPEGQFQRSWENYWQPLERDLSPQSPESTPGPPTDDKDDSGLGTGAKVGIAIGAIVGALIILGAVFYFKRRSKRPVMGPSHTFTPVEQGKEQPIQYYGGPAVEIQGSEPTRYEMDAGTR